MQLRVTKPLSELQDDAYNKLRTDIYEFIITTKDFPEWKQANYADTWANLSIKQLSTALTTEELSVLAVINSTRTWKDNLIAERDRVKTLIFNSVNIAEIRDAVDSFVYAVL